MRNRPIQERSQSTTSIPFACGIIIGGILMSPLLSLLLSKCWWQFYYLVYPLPGDLPRRIPIAFGPVWVCDWNSYVALFFMGVMLQLIAFIVHIRSGGLQSGDLQQLFARMHRNRSEYYGVSHFVRCARFFAWYILLPQLLILLYLGLWTIAKSVQEDPSATVASTNVVKRLAVDFGPAFCLGLGVLLVVKAALIIDVLRPTFRRKANEKVLEEVTPLTSRRGLKIVSALGGLLVLPSAASIVALCWIVTLKQCFGANSLQGLNRVAPALLSAIYTMGPANLVGCAILLWVGSEWISLWRRNSLRKEKSRDFSLLNAAKIGVVFSCLLLSPILLVLVISGWVTINQLIRNSIELDGLSSSVMLNYGGFIVAGCVVLVLSAIAWYVGICLAPAGNNIRANQVSPSPILPRLSKLGVMIGCVLLSPMLVRAVVVVWNYFYFSLVVPLGSNDAWSTATQVLSREYEITRPVIMGGYLILIASGLGAALAGLMPQRQNKPVIGGSESFDDM